MQPAPFTLSDTPVVPQDESFDTKRWSDPTSQAGELVIAQEQSHAPLCACGLEATVVGEKLLGHVLVPVASNARSVQPEGSAATHAPAGVEQGGGGGGGGESGAVSGSLVSLFASATASTPASLGVGGGGASPLSSTLQPAKNSPTATCRSTRSG